MTDDPEDFKTPDDMAARSIPWAWMKPFINNQIPDAVRAGHSICITGDECKNANNISDSCNPDVSAMTVIDFKKPIGYQLRWGNRRWGHTFVLTEDQAKSLVDSDDKRVNITGYRPVYITIIQPDSNDGTNGRAMDD